MLQTRISKAHRKSERLAEKLMMMASQLHIDELLCCSLEKVF